MVMIDVMKAISHSDECAFNGNVNSMRFWTQPVLDGFVDSGFACAV